MSDPADPSSTGTSPPASTSATDPVIDRLHELKVDPSVAAKIVSDLGVTTIADLATLTEDDLISVGMKKVPARNFLTAVKAAAPAPAHVPAAGSFGTMSFDDVLPVVPSDASWLEALKVGGVLKVDQSTVISAVRAALAHRAGLFNILDKVVDLMERFADENEEQLDTDFFRLRKQMTRRSYAEIFEAIDGLDGSYVTEKRKTQLLQKIDRVLWPAIIDFYGQLRAWQEAWLQGAANPMVMLGMFMSGSGGGSGMMPPGMMQPPDTGVLRDHADAVANAVNKVFAGTGVQIAAALAYDASRIKETLANPRLPALIGAANRDQMLRQLGAAVPATYPRLETNLTKFVLSIMQAKDQAAGQEELKFFGALCMLGAQIQWDQLGEGSAGNGKSLTGVGVGVARRDVPRDGRGL